MIQKDQTYLKLLIGKKVSKTEHSTNIIIPIKDVVESSTINTSIYIQVYFEDYRLNIYNLISISPQGKIIADIVGLTVIEAYESDEEAVLIFNNEYKLIVNMRDEAYSDPEAMYLAGPNNFWVVWN